MIIIYKTIGSSHWPMAKKRTPLAKYLYNGYDHIMVTNYSERMSAEGQIVKLIIYKFIIRRINLFTLLLLQHLASYIPI